jgi:hypothetical protein
MGEAVPVTVITEDDFRFAGAEGIDVAVTI